MGTRIWSFIAPITNGNVLWPSTKAKAKEYLQKCGSLYLLMNGYGKIKVGAAVSCNYCHIFEFNNVDAPFVKTIISAFDMETGKKLAYGQGGKSCIRTPSVMMGCINVHEETEHTICLYKDDLKWVHSGNLCYVTEDGFFALKADQNGMCCVSLTESKRRHLALILKRLFVLPSCRKLRSRSPPYGSWSN